jgi:hypothetical protein
VGSGHLRRPRAALATVAATVLAAGVPAAPASAREQPAQPSPPGLGSPRVVFAPRDLRMSPAGVIAVRVGCWSAEGDLCIGRMEPALARPIRAPRSRGGMLRTWRPFVLARRPFSVRGAEAKVVRVQLFPRGSYLTRLAGTIPVRITARYRSRTGRRLTASTVINVYVPARA